VSISGLFYFGQDENLEDEKGLTCSKGCLPFS
jgi:hypothetical protein